MEVHSLALSLDTSGVVAGAAAMKAAQAKVSQGATEMLSSIQRLQQQGFDRMAAGMSATARMQSGFIANTYGGNWGRGMERLQQQQQRAVENMYGPRGQTAAQPVGDMMSKMSKSSVNAIQGGAGVDRWTAGLGKLKMAAESLDSPLKKFQRNIAAAKQSLDGFMERVKQSQGSMGALGAAFAGFAVGAFIRETALLAARYETLGVAMYRSGANAGFSRVELEKMAAAMENTGISMMESRQQLLTMMEAQIDLASATKLARVAQDAAVIANINSSEAFGRMIHGLQTGNILILRNLGLSVNFQKAYEEKAKTLRKNVDALSESERAQARVNTVLEKGKLIAGTYEAAMTTAGKQLNSSVRYLQNFKVKFGEAFNPTMAAAVKAYADALKWMAENTDIVAAGVSLMAGAIAAKLIPAVWGLVAAMTALKATPVGIFTTIAQGLATFAGFAWYKKQMEEVADWESLKKDPEAALRRFQMMQDTIAKQGGQATPEAIQQVTALGQLVATQVQEEETAWSRAFDKYATTRQRERAKLTRAEKEEAKKLYPDLRGHEMDKGPVADAGKKHDEMVQQQMDSIKLLTAATREYWDAWANNTYLVEVYRQQEAVLQRMLQDTKLSAEDRAAIEGQIRDLHKSLVDALGTDPLEVRAVLTVDTPSAVTTKKMIDEWADGVSRMVANLMGSVVEIPVVFKVPKNVQEFAPDKNNLPDWKRTVPREEGTPPPGYDENNKPLVADLLKGQGGAGTSAADAAAEDATEKVDLVKEAWIQAARSMQQATADFLIDLTDGFKNAEAILKNFLKALQDVFAQMAAAGIMNLAQGIVQGIVSPKAPDVFSPKASGKVPGVNGLPVEEAFPALPGANLRVTPEVEPLPELASLSVAVTPVMAALPELPPVEAAVEPPSRLATASPVAPPPATAEDSWEALGGLLRSTASRLEASTVTPAAPSMVTPVAASTVTAAPAAVAAPAPTPAPAPRAAPSPKVTERDGTPVTLQLNQQFATNALDGASVEVWFRKNRDTVAAATVEALSRNTTLLNALRGVGR